MVDAVNKVEAMLKNPGSRLFTGQITNMRKRGCSVSSRRIERNAFLGR